MEQKEKGTYDIVTNAIIQKVMVCFAYENQKSNELPEAKIHYVEPYVLGKHKTTKNLILSAYFLPTREQISKGEKEGWKLYLLNNISDCIILDISFDKIRPKYNPKPEMMEAVFCYIQP